jgi:hypothetical protein
MNNEDEIRRLQAKTRNKKFIQTLVQQYQYAPKIAEAILAEAQACFVGNPEHLRPGQVRVILAKRNSRPGRSLGEIATAEVILTVDGGMEDRLVLQEQGSRALRQVRIQRLLDEALEQGAVATQEDLAQVLHASLRAIKRDFAKLQADEVSLPSRGYLHGVGRGQTHKAQIIRRWLLGETFDQIEKHTRHTSSAIQRYLQAFILVVQLHGQGFSDHQIALLVSLSVPLVQDYLEVYHHNQTPDCQERLESQLQHLSQTKAVAKKGVI